MGELVPIVGCTKVPMQHRDNQEFMLELVVVVVVKGNHPSLFGRNWLSKIKLDWESIFSVKRVAKPKVSAPQSSQFPQESKNVLNQDSSLFSRGELGIKRVLLHLSS